MPTGIYKRSPEQIKKALENIIPFQFQKGHSTSKEIRLKMKKNHKGMSGKHHSKTTKIKMRKSHKGKKLSKKHRKNLSKSHIGVGLGRKNTKETIEKMKIAQSKRTKKTRMKMSKAQKGEKGSNWQGGKSSKNERARKSTKFELWREKVFAKDNWTCQKYGVKGSELHPHHIKNFAEYPELRFVVSNGITFSEKAHKEFHKKYGFKNNTEEQLKEFLSK